MKYLIFNATVFLALGYLIMGGDTQQLSHNVQQSLEKVKTQVEQVSEEPVVQKLAKPIIQPNPKAKPAPPPLEEPVIEEVVEKPALPPAIPEPVQVAKPMVKEIPSRAVEVEVAKAAEPVFDNVVEPEEKLVTAKDRSKELRQMVADMERMFAEKLTR